MIQMILFFTLAYECRERSDYLFCILFSDYIILLGQEYGNWSVEMGMWGCFGVCFWTTSFCYRRIMGTEACNWALEDVNFFFEIV